MEDDFPDGEPADLGSIGSVDPFDEKLHFLEDPLSRSKIEAVRPFVDEKSVGGGSPIRIVACPDDTKFIMQGNHRIYAAREDRLRVVSVRLYTPRQWEDSFDTRFRAVGNNNPGIGP